MSLGEQNEEELNDVKLEFKENKVKDKTKINARALTYCKYLNLRGSSFDQLEA